MRGRHVFSATAALLAMTPAAHAYDNAIRGAVIDAAIGTSQVGDSLTGEIGGESEGLRVSRDRAWMMQWDVFAALEAGWLANAHPFLFLIGPHALAMIEGGRRLVPSSSWSPYLGARIAGEAQLLGSPGAGPFDTLNAVDGVGGVVAQGSGRVAVGASFLDGRHSLLAVLFAQEALQAPQVATPSRAFTELGVALRYDMEHSMTGTLEGLWGVTPDRVDVLRGSSDQTSRLALSATFRKIFSSGVWLGASLSLARDGDHVVFAKGATFDTTDAPRFAFSVLLGVPLWRAK